MPEVKEKIIEGAKEKAIMNKNSIVDSVDTLNSLIERVKKAQEIYATYPQ